MQSTGYKDRKDTEIFIGDIVKIYVEDREEHKVYYSLCKVVFDEETSTTKLEIIERFCDMLMPVKYLYFKTEKILIDKILKTIENEKIREIVYNVIYLRFRTAKKLLFEYIEEQEKQND